MTITEYLRRRGLDSANAEVKAAALGVSTVTLWRILNGKTGISTRTIARIRARTRGAVGYEDLADEASAK